MPLMKTHQAINWPEVWKEIREVIIKSWKPELLWMPLLTTQRVSIWALLLLPISRSTGGIGLTLYKAAVTPQKPPLAPNPCNEASIHHSRCRGTMQAIKALIRNTVTKRCSGRLFPMSHASASNWTRILTESRRHSSRKRTQSVRRVRFRKNIR